MTRNKMKCPKCERTIYCILACDCGCEDIICPKCTQIIGTKTKGIMTRKEYEERMLEFCED